MHLDRHYTDPRLAAIYDVENAGRDDTRFYVRLARDLEARRVVDLGCGTGVLARELADRGLEVTGVDPSPAMLEVARSGSGADDVRWIEGASDRLPRSAFDLAVMTGHVAQVFLDDEEWRDVLAGVRSALAGAGHVAFETRNPSVAAWREWTKARTFSRFPATDDHEGFDSWVEVVDERPVPAWSTWRAIPSSTHPVRTLSPPARCGSARSTSSRPISRRPTSNWFGPTGTGTSAPSPRTHPS